MTEAFREALDRIPEGYSEGLYYGQRYRMEKSSHAGGKGLKFYARALGRTDFVSLNLYRLASGDLLKPCEMPEAKVRDFVLNVTLLLDTKLSEAPARHAYRSGECMNGINEQPR